MRPRLSSLTLTAALLAALSGTISQAGCGGASNEQAGVPEAPVRLAAVDVTYYYLPG